MSPSSFFQRRFDAWLERRLPRVDRVQLGSKSLFTFPSAGGAGFLAVVVLLWLLATNYENNVIFALGALLGAVMVVTIFHSFANLSGLQVQVRSVSAGFPGEMLRVELVLSQAGRRLRDDIRLSFPGSAPVAVALDGDHQTASAVLYVPARRRGRRHLERVTIESTYPLGLIRVWTHVLLSGHGIVYPRPVEGVAQAGSDSGDSARGRANPAGQEDFAGLRSYIPGESASRIAWKQFARGQGLHSKTFSDPVADPQWLDWEHYPGMDREARLSRLCHDVLACARKSDPFGLRLPGQVVPLGVGNRHRDQMLTALALFEVD